MKRKLLTMLAFALACSGAWAYNTNGDYNSFGVKCWVDGGNNIQYIDVQTAGNFATFCQDGDFNTYFNKGTTTYDKVVFSGAMNDADLAEIKTLNYDPSTWAPVVANFDKVKCIDFTDVTTAIKPTFSWGEWGNAPSALVIWPAATTVTKDDLKIMTDYAIPRYKVCYAYYDDNNKDILKFVVGSGNDALDISNQTTFLQTLMSTEDLTFKALEMTYGWNGTSYVYSNVASNFLSNMGKLPVVSLNLCGCNISSLGKDFSALNTSTDYIILPCNNSVYTADEDFYKFTWNDNVCVVASFVSTEAPYGKGGNMDGYNYSVVNDPSPVSSITMTYVHKEDKLAGGAPYLPAVMQNAEKTVICGVLGKDDIQAIDHMNSAYIDLSLASIDASEVDIASYSNAKTNWLAVPNNTRPEQIDAIYATQKAANSNFVGVAGFTTQALEATETYRAVPSNTLITYTAQQGAVYNLVYMIEETNTGQFASGVNNLIMSGHLNAFDICNSSQAQTTTGQCVYSDGHIYMVGSEPEGTTQQTSGALNGATIANVDFTNAIFDQPTESELTAESCTGYFTADEKKNLVTDMNMVVCGIVPSETLLLPTDPSQKVIPAHFMSKSGNDGVSDLCIPYNFQYIMDYAFNACENHLNHIYTTADPNAEGLIDSEVDHESYYLPNMKENGVDKLVTSYTIGSKVKYIAVGAFDTGDTNDMGDVYVLAQTAPICEPNAFNSVKLMGNNGFVMSHPISRNNYINAGWIATLHFPNALSDEVKKGYTDIDREYWYNDETGAVDGEGNLLKWPCHTEFMRSWNQANLGYTWKEWDTSRELRESFGTYGQVLVVGKYGDSFESIPEIETTTTTQWVDDGKQYAVVTGEYETITDQHADCTKCGFAGNIGWHQFLLAAPGYFYEVESTNYVETPWYSFCIPFDMTLDELNKYLGVPETASSNAGAQPDVRTLRSVERNTTGRHTNLTISKNLVKAAQDVETYGATDNAYRKAEYVNISTQKDGEPVYLKGGYPYFVKGWVPEGTDLSKYNNNLGQYVLAIARFSTEDLGNVIIIDPSATEAADENIVNTKHWEEGDQNFIAMPYFNHTVDAYSEVDEVFYGQRTTLPTGVEEDVPYLYNFMGNYEPEDFETSDSKVMPQYSYYMASGKIYRYKTVKSGYLWKPYICMVGLNGEGTVYQKMISNVMTYHSAYKNVTDDNKWGANEFAKEGDAANAGTFSISFDDDDFPGGDVDKIININGQEVNVTVSGVYNLNGQYVGNSLNSLAKGVYVVNGKKIVVK